YVPHFRRRKRGAVMIDFRDVRDISFGGMADTLALLVADAGAFLTLPTLYGTDWHGLFLAAACAAIGGLWLGWRVGSKLRLTHGGAFDINSHDVPDVDAAGMRIGFVAHTMRELVIPLSAWM